MTKCDFLRSNANFHLWIFSFVGPFVQRSIGLLGCVSNESRRISCGEISLDKGSNNKDGGSPRWYRGLGQTSGRDPFTENLLKLEQFISPKFVQVFQAAVDFCQWNHRFYWFFPNTFEHVWRVVLGPGGKAEVRLLFHCNPEGRWTSLQVQSWLRPLPATRSAAGVDLSVFPWLTPSSKYSPLTRPLSSCFFFVRLPLAFKCE